jgi:hypothetical protein
VPSGLRNGDFSVSAGRDTSLSGVEVQWLSGRTQKLGNLASNRVVVIDER